MICLNNMIPVTKDYIAIPPKLNYAVAPLSTAYADLIMTKNNHKFKSSIYRGGSLTKLKEIYKNKCGYCETVTAAGAELRVDHYRPKDKVKEDPMHLTGYYWLAYEWSNLVLACEKCNRAKSNKFPLEQNGTRCYQPLTVVGSTDFDKLTFSISHPSLCGELPSIVNPEVDTNLIDWFVFLPNGEIKEINNHSRMKETIKVCKLNREPLILDRKKIFDDIVTKIERYLNDYIADNDTPKITTRVNDILDELILQSDEENKYSRFCYFLYLKFDLFIQNKFDLKSRTLITNLFLPHRLANLGF